MATLLLTCTCTALKVETALSAVAYSWYHMMISVSIHTCTCGCAVLLCLVCLFHLACFFLSSFSSLIQNMYICACFSCIALPGIQLSYIYQSCFGSSGGRVPAYKPGGRGFESRPR